MHTQSSRVFPLAAAAAAVVGRVKYVPRVSLEVSSLVTCRHFSYGDNNFISCQNGKWALGRIAWLFD